jgi:HD-GYP domain-containing protein (c-di-GMP phosphodiesterase class II)
MAAIDTISGLIRRTWNSLRFRVVGAVAALVAVSAASAVFVLTQVDLRQHDYAILNLSGQLRVAARAMVGQAESVLRTKDGGEVDSNRFFSDLGLHVAIYDEIMTSFETRELSPRLTGAAEPLRCEWDSASRKDLAALADGWRSFRDTLLEIEESGREDRTRAAASFVVANGHELTAATDALTDGIQHMMEDKLATIKNTIVVSLGVGALVLLGVAGWLDRGAFGPMRQTSAGFERAAQGDLGHQVPVPKGTEVARMVRSFNRLLNRVQAIVRLTDRINQGNNLGQAVSSVHEEVSRLLPLDWTGVLVSSPSRQSLVLERCHGRSGVGLVEGAEFDGPTVLAVARNSEVVSVGQLSDFCTRPSKDGLLCRLARNGMRSTVLLPLASSGDLRAVLVFATATENAYDDGHLELLSNVAGLLGHGIEKTLVVEDLVVAAVNGLARLAESRDPETGDHLARMALYSEAIAWQLLKDGMFPEELTAEKVREVVRFAPMHDIGKVGVEDSVLLKQGRLSEEERLAMQQHPRIGAEVLERCEHQMELRGRSVFTTGIEIAECHHERYDGRGYPAGVSGDEIPLSARIVAVCDVFDALTSKRPYKEAWSVDRAFAQIERDAGAHFDPAVVNALFASKAQILQIYERYKHV